jgi:hypothetical protein
MMILKIVQLANPSLVPLGTWRKVEHILGHEQARACGRNDDQQADDAAQERREFWPQDASDDVVGDGEGKTCNERELSDAEAFDEGPVGTEEPRQHTYQGQGDQESDDAMDGGDLYGDFHQIVGRSWARWSSRRSPDHLGRCSRRPGSGCRLRQTIPACSG